MRIRLYDIDMYSRLMRGRSNDRRGSGSGYMMWYSRRLIMLALAVLAGAGAIPRIGAPTGAATSSASLAIGAASEPIQESQRTEGASAPLTAGQDGAPAGANAVPTGLPQAMRFATSATAGGGTRTPRRDHRAGGPPGPSVTVMPASLARDLTVITRGVAPVSPARHVCCNAHGARAGPLA